MAGPRRSSSSSAASRWASWGESSRRTSRWTSEDRLTAADEPVGPAATAAIIRKHCNITMSRRGSKYPSGSPCA